MSRKSATSGVLWSIVDLGGGQALSFATFLIVARIVSPEEYGTFALASSIISFAFFLVQGLAPAVVQRRSITAVHTSTAFWTSAAAGCSCTALIAASAHALSELLDNPLLEPVLAWMSLICLPMSLTSVPMALLRRELRMAGWAARTFTGYIAIAAVSIPLALNDFGALALAFGQIAQSVTTIAVVFAASRWRPRLQFSMPVFFELGRYSAHYITGTAIWVATSKVDVWILAAFLDARSVGLYALATRVLEAVASVTTLPVMRLTVPLLSPLRSDAAQFTRQYERVVIGATSAWLPAVLGIGVALAPFVPDVLGERWAESVPVLQAMCLSAFTLSVTWFTGETLSAWGRPDVFSRLEGIRLLVTAVAFLIAAQFGTVAAGFAWALVPVILFPIHLTVLAGTASIRADRLLAGWSKLAVSGSVMVGVMFAVGRLNVFGQWVPVAALAAGAATYALLLDRVMLRGCVNRVISSAIPVAVSQVKR
ncbi:MAG: lipopolysaccharide biosynthesis protein [Gemmatimonas sp.]